MLLIAVKAMKSSIKPSNTLITQLEKAVTRNLKEHVMHLLSLLYTHSRICHLHFVGRLELLVGRLGSGVLACSKKGGGKMIEI